MDITISYSDMKFYHSDLEELIYRVLTKGAELQNVSEDAEISVLICDADTIHELNKTYRNIDAPTDVLSFALNEGEDDIPEEERALGDIIINIDRAEWQAKEYGHSKERETAYLAVHGFLHILGYDHYEAEEKKAMRKAEEDILSACGLKRIVTEGQLDRGENNIQELIEQTLQIRDCAYAPYSDYPVGALAVTEDGKYFSGCNVENVSYPAGSCAERNAIAAAIAAGNKNFAFIIIAGDLKHPTYPCGICRQVMVEFQIPYVIIAKENKQCEKIALEELLPHSFTAALVKNIRSYK